MIEASPENDMNIWKISFYSLHVLHIYGKVCLQQSKSLDLIYIQFENTNKLIDKKLHPTVTGVCSQVFV